MRATAELLALAAAVSVAGAASPSSAHASAGEGQAGIGDAARARDPGPRLFGANDFAMPPEMIQKLSPEQIVSVLRERERGLRPGGGVLLPMIFFGTLGSIVLLAQMYATRRERIRQDTLRAMVDKGMEIPPDLIAKSAGPLADLRRGLVLVGAGAGLSLAFAVVHLSGKYGPGLWAIGLIPMLMGAGYLVVWRMATKKASDG